MFVPCTKSKGTGYARSLLNPFGLRSSAVALPQPERAYNYPKPSMRLQTQRTIQTNGFPINERVLDQMQNQ